MGNDRSRNAHLLKVLHAAAEAAWRANPRIRRKEDVPVILRAIVIVAAADAIKRLIKLERAKGAAAERKLASTERPEGTPPQPVAEPDAPKEEKT